MRFHRHDLIFNLRPTSKISPENIFPNPAGRLKIFSRIPPAENIFPNPAGRFFFLPNPADRPKLFARKLPSESRRPTENIFANPAGRPKLFSESRRPAEFIFPNPAGRSFFPNPADRKMSVRKCLSEKCPFENFGSIDSIIDSIRSILVEPAVGDRPDFRSFRKVFQVFGFVRTCSDPFACIWMHSDAFGSV